MDKAQRRKFLMGMGIAAPLAMQWQKPIISAVITPAHAQMSAPPIVSNVSCSFDTSTIRVGSVITMSASISDVDTPISEIRWILATHGDDVYVYAGRGQFPVITYKVQQRDVGVLDFNLIVIDNQMNEVFVPLCFFTIS